MSDFVTYEAFGAVGDGVTDDTAAIVAAHAYANEHGLPVKTDPDATYYIGGVFAVTLRGRRSVRCVRASVHPSSGQFPGRGSLPRISRGS